MATNEEVAQERAARVARIKRDLAELRGRMGRIEGETFRANQQIGELEAELTALAGGAP